MTTQAAFAQQRAHLLADDGASIVAVERKYMRFLSEVTLQTVPAIYADFGQARNFLPFWSNYAPKQRGRQPRGTSIPWSEVGEKTISLNLTRAIAQHLPNISFPGLPFGGDIRFMTEDALIHFDVKLTGPNDNPDEIVASPYQVTGDGARWNKQGMMNNVVTVQGKRAQMLFQPELPPFYMTESRTLICLTYFLKAVYSVESLGMQPLRFLEVACVPNGLLMFAGPNLSRTTGLMIPGKDEKTFAHKRVRVRLSPLGQLGDWRCIKFVHDGDTWRSELRHQPTL